jgi:apolipoprotein N-acyltransferase
MAIGVMVTKPASTDPSVKDIIAAARARQQPAIARPGSAGAWLLSGLTAILLWASFTPVDAGPLAWIALVPLLVLVRIPQPTRWMYRAVFVSALANQLATLQWMRLGDPTMYIALAALATYCALYLPVFVALARFAHHRWCVPLVIAVPVLWAGLEYARGHLMTGFAWYFLGHSQYRWLELIQISDLVGAYGVSFVVAMANAALVGLISPRWLLRLRLISAEDALLQSAVPFRSALAPVLASAVVVAAVLGYGVVRRQQADFRPGPRVALIQGNFVASLRQPPHDPEQMLLTHLRLTGLAVREQPDLIVWPEAMYPYILLDADPGLTDDQLRDLTPGANSNPNIWRDGIVKGELARESQRASAALLWGVHAAQAQPTGIQELNSAVFVTPEQGVVGRYDKRHLVPFGEFIPLKHVLPWLQRMTPYRGDVGLAAGTQPMVFDYKAWRFSPVICFEDTVPHVVRSAVAAGSR